MRWQTGPIMITFRLAKILITNAVQEYHEDRDGNEE